MKKVTRKDNDFIRATVTDFINGNDQAKVILVETIYGGAKDKAHGTDHIYNVLADAKKIKGSNLSVAETLAIIFHDAGNEVDRDDHEKIGANYFMEIISGIKYTDTLKVAHAIREHRASYKGKFSSPVSELLSSADRGKPDSLAYTLKRSYDYAVKHGDNHEEAINHAIKHIKEKYSRNGYARIPNMYKQYYKDILIKFWDEIDNFTPEQAKRMIEDYHD